MTTLTPLQLFKNLSDEWVHYRLSPHIPAWAAAIIEQTYLSQRDEITLLTQGNVTPDSKMLCN